MLYEIRHGMSFGTYTGMCGDNVCHLELTPEPVEITYVIGTYTGTCGDNVCHLEFQHRNLWILRM